MIDYKSIIENLQDDKIINLVTELGSPDYKETDNSIIFHTICHNVNGNEASMKLYYYKDSHMFYCYSECQQMSIFRMLKNYYECRGIEYDWFEDVLQVILNCSAATNINKERHYYKSIKDIYNNSYEDYQFTKLSPHLLDTFVDQYHPSWINDGISKRTMQKYNIKFSISQNKIIIPHYDYEGDLIGIRGRALNEWEIENVAKYSPVWIQGKCYSHPLSMNLYGFNMNCYNIASLRFVFIGESEKFVMQLEEFARPNCGVAICGSHFNKHQLKILLRYGNVEEIVFCLDKEELPGEDKYFSKLYNMCKTYGRYTKTSFIYDRDNLLELKDSPTDKGEDVFETLLERRVIV